MRTLFALVLLAAACWAQGTPKSVNPRTYRLQWEDLDRRVRGRNVQLVLPSGVRLSGVVVSVDPQQLRLEVKGTSDRLAYPKGRAAIPRSGLPRLCIVETSSTGKVIGSAAGAGVGLLLGAIGGVGGASGGTVAALVAIPTIVGVLVGAAADVTKTDILIEPAGDPAPAAASSSALLLPSWVGHPLPD
jgi:hypothetical protein